MTVWCHIESNHASFDEQLELLQVRRAEGGRFINGLLLGILYFLEFLWPSDSNNATSWVLFSGIFDLHTRPKWFFLIGVSSSDPFTEVIADLRIEKLSGTVPQLAFC